MKNIDAWSPTKFVIRKNRLRSSLNTMHVGISSRLTADKVAQKFDLYLKDHAAGKLIDLGCGKVPLYEAYKNYCTEVTCVDWKASDGVNHLDLEADLNEPLSVTSAAYDTVLLSDVLEHIAKPWQLWGEISRILRPSGKLILSVPFYYQLHEVPYDYYRYTYYALKRFAEENGFKVLVLEAYGGFPEILADLLAKNVLRIPGIGRLLSRFFQASCGLFLKLKSGRTISAKTSAKFPLGYFMVAEKI